MIEKYKFLEVRKLDTLKEIESFLFSGPYQEAIRNMNWKNGSGSQSWKQLIENKLGIVYAVKDNNKFIGLIAGFLSPNLYNQDEIQGYISLLFVCNEYRNNGVAGKLYNLFEKWCKENEVKQIISGGFLTPGLAFFKSKGFNELETISIKNLKESEK